MSDPKLEEVYKLSGIPTYTFVKPREYKKLLVSLRTPGRGLVIEGPSGIGKTTAVTRALNELESTDDALHLSARKDGHRELIRDIPGEKNAGTIIIDDFHRLGNDTRSRVADYLKTLADEERTDTKLIVVGINRAGETLISFASDLAARIDTITFEANPSERVRELVGRGEQALNIELSITDEIVEAAAGSFYLAQYLSHQTCLEDNILEAQESETLVETSFEVVRSNVVDKLSRRFLDTATDFAQGTRLRREGRAPYLHILKWLSEANEWSIQLDREMVRHPELKGSVNQVVEKGYLEDLISDEEKFEEVLHYDPKTRVLAAEDPQFVFFLRNILWNKFAERVGFINIEFESRYDFALSFAGPDREYAELLFEELTERECEVFYDKNEQHRILAENVEEYLAPIYRSEAKYVVCMLGPEYPERIWTRFESEQFEERFGEGAVIPIWFENTTQGMFDRSTEVGGMTFDPEGAVDDQIEDIAENLVRKLGENAVEE